MKVIMIISFLISLLTGCVRSEQLYIGGLYSIDDGEGWYRIAKVLATDKEGVHIRLYKNRWKERPITIDENSLSLGTVHDNDGFGMGHLPLKKSSFQAWSPILIKVGKVVDTELDGYKEWQSAGGGYF